MTLAHMERLANFEYLSKSLFNLLVLIAIWSFFDHHLSWCHSTLSLLLQNRFEYLKFEFWSYFEFVPIGPNTHLHHILFIDDGK
jgi:hypothetical protein